MECGVKVTHKKVTNDLIALHVPWVNFQAGRRECTGEAQIQKLQYIFGTYKAMVDKVAATGTAPSPSPVPVPALD